MVLTPYGTLWQVHNYDTAAGDPEQIYKRWEQASVTRDHQGELVLGLHYVNPHKFAKGSWEFAALTILNDGEYQNGLFRLSHWLSKAKRIASIEQLVEFVQGLHATTEILEQVFARDAITYPDYDVRKNAAVARMHFHTGLEVLVSVVNGENKSPPVRRLQSNRLFMELKDQGLLLHVQEARDVALEVIGGLLPEMRARSDPHLDAFLEFVEKHSTNRVDGENLPTAPAMNQQVVAEKQPAAAKRKRRAKASRAKKSKRT